MNAADILSAVDTVKTLAARLEAITKLAGVLESIGTMTQAADEAVARKAVADAAEKAAQEELVAAQAAVQAATAQAEKIKADAMAAGQALYDKAAVDAQAMVEQAQAKAEKFKSDAEARAAQVIADVNQQLASLHGTKAAVEKDLAGHNAAVDAVRTELSSLESRLAEAKRAARAVIEG